MCIRQSGHTFFQLILELRSFERKRTSNCRHDDVCNVEDTRVERRRDDERFEQSGTSEVERFEEYGSHKRTPWENNRRTRNSTVAQRKGENVDQRHRAPLVLRERERETLMVMNRAGMAGSQEEKENNLDLDRNDSRRKIISKTILSASGSTVHGGQQRNP